MPGGCRIGPNPHPDPPNRQRAGPHQSQRASHHEFVTSRPRACFLLPQAGIANDDNDRPKLTLLIPPAVPIDLSLNVSMGESRIDLGGLTLSEPAVALTPARAG